MKRKEINLREITDYDNPIAGIDVASTDYLIGEVFSHSELLGLTERQLSAYKTSLRKIIWDWYNSHFDNPSGLADISAQAREKLAPNYTWTISTPNGVRYEK